MPKIKIAWEKYRQHDGMFSDPHQTTELVYDLWLALKEALTPDQDPQSPSPHPHQRYLNAICERDAAWTAYCEDPTDANWRDYVRAGNAEAKLTACPQCGQELAIESGELNLVVNGSARVHYAACPDGDTEEIPCGFFIVRESAAALWEAIEAARKKSQQIPKLPSEAELAQQDLGYR